MAAALGIAFFSTLVVGQGHAHYCPKCVKIETEREKEQAQPDYKAPGYYDGKVSKDNKEAVKSVDVPAQTGNKQEEARQEEGLALNFIRSQTWLAANENMSLPSTPNSNPPKNQVPAQDLRRAQTVSTIMDVLGIRNLFATFEGPFTIFVPSDEAVSNFPSETFANMIKPENRELLYALITNHVVPNQILRKDFNKTFKTLGGRIVELQENEKGVTVNGARILKSDSLGSAGVVYVIDQVLIPIHD